MIVYVITEGCIHEGGGVNAVFTNKEKAVAYAAHLVDKENASIEAGNAMVREEHEPGGRFADFPFDPMSYYVPAEAEMPCAASWVSDCDYIDVVAYVSDPEIPDSPANEDPTYPATTVASNHTCTQLSYEMLMDAVKSLGKADPDGAQRR